MNSNRLYQGLALLSIVLAGYLVVRDREFLLCYANSECRDMKVLEDWKRAYENDTYGGKTPEETLQLFTDALKKGDINLASKYFLLDKQELELNKLASIRNDLSLALADLAKLRLSKREKERAYYVVPNEVGMAEVTVLLTKLPNGVWKIAEL